MRADPELKQALARMLATASTSNEELQPALDNFFDDRVPSSNERNALRHWLADEGLVEGHFVEDDNGEFATFDLEGLAPDFVKRAEATIPSPSVQDNRRQADPPAAENPGSSTSKSPSWMSEHSGTVVATVLATVFAGLLVAWLTGAFDEAEPIQVDLTSGEVIQETRTLTINPGFDSVRESFLKNGGSTVEVLSGDIRGELGDAGVYTHDRESDDAYSFGFNLGEYDRDGGLLAEHTITVTVAALAESTSCSPLRILNLRATSKSPNVTAITWLTSTPATETVELTMPTGEVIQARQSGEYYENFTNELGNFAWSATDPLQPGTEYTATVTVESQCDPGDTATDSITFQTSEP